ncbi:MAG: hypothetical protein HZA37_01695 [Parcubacteria group bacterium]|nr:hypothetical protein [Parcubacteria group bacterium]
MIHWGSFVRNGRKIKVYHTHYNGGRNQVFGRDEWCVIILDKNGSPVDEIFFPFISGLSAPSPDDVRDLWAKVLSLFDRDSIAVKVEGGAR